MKGTAMISMPAALLAGVLLAGCNIGGGGNGDTDGDNDTQTDEVTLSVALSALFEVPEVSVASNGSGTGEIVVNTATGELSGGVEVAGLTGDATAAHIHEGRAGVAGGVLVTLEQDALYPEQWKVPANAELSDSEVDLLLDGRLYVNVHTAANSAGEVRGQILPNGYEVVRIELSGDNEVPVVSTTATGVGFATLNHNDRTLDLVVTLSDLDDDSAAHIHDGFAGANGDVVVGLSHSSDDVWETLVDAELDQNEYDTLVGGGLYVNVHSSSHNGGEIRGQIAPKDILVVRTELSGDNEVPEVDPAGTGVGYTTVNTQSGSLIVNLRTADLTSNATAAHIHQAPAGSDDGVLLGLEQDASDAAVWHAPDNSVLNADGLTALFDDELYFHVHTVNNSDGEMRGQIEP